MLSYVVFKDIFWIISCPLLFHFQVTVAVHVTQAEYNRTFKFETKLSGLVHLTYRDSRKKDKKAIIQTQTAQLSEILGQHTGPWKTDQNVVTITTEGKVDLHYFTDEKTVIHEKELKEEQDEDEKKEDEKEDEKKEDEEREEEKEEEEEEQDIQEDEGGHQRPLEYDEDAYPLPNEARYK